MIPPAVNPNRLIETVIDLCRIPSPSGREDLVKAYVEKRLDALGCPVSADSFGNLYTATESTDFEDVFLSCHLDTVPVPEGSAISVIRKGGRISSDGRSILGGDDKLGIAAALEMLALCREHPGEHRGLDVIFTVKEEIGAQGGRAVEPGRLRARDGFNLDGEIPPGSVVYRAPQKGQFTCVVRGRSSHAALAPEKGVNAVVVAATIISRLPVGIPGPESTSNVGRISGGTQTNVVPDRIEFSGELRSFSPVEFAAVRDNIGRICRDTAREMGGSAEVVWLPTYDGCTVTRDAPCARWFVSACEKRGITPEFRSSRGGGDANQLNAKGLRNLVFGLGMHNIHSVDEYVIEEEFVRGVKLLREIVFP